LGSCCRREGGFTQVEVWPTPATIEAIEACAPVLELLQADTVEA
jgi:hypothetical protein